MLLDALNSREPRLRALASRALVDLRAKPDALMPSLLRQLQGGRPEVWPDVMNVLAGLGDAALPGLIRALGLKEVRPRAAAILARLGPSAKEAVPALIRAAQSGDPLARHEALLALGAIGPAAVAAVPVAVKSLEDVDPNVRYSACYALGKIGPPAMAASDPLRQVLSDSDPFLSLVAAWALARIAPDCSDTVPKSVPLLIRAGRPGTDDPPGGRQFVALHRAQRQERRSGPEEDHPRRPQRVGPRHGGRGPAIGAGVKGPPLPPGEGRGEGNRQSTSPEAESVAARPHPLPLSQRERGSHSHLHHLLILRHGDVPALRRAELLGQGQRRLLLRRG